MKGSIDRIRRNFDSECIVDRLRRDTCEISLVGLPEPQLLIDLDRPGSPLDQQSVRCDYLVFAGDEQSLFLAAPVEVKTKWREKVLKQLQAGADESDRHAPTGQMTRFRPVAALNKFSMLTRRELRERVAFRGREEPVRVVLCGEELAPVLGLDQDQPEEV